MRFERCGQPTQPIRELGAGHGGLRSQRREERGGHKVLQQKQHGKIPSVVNSPWLLVTIPLVGFAVWLANNTGVITNNWDKPYLLLAGPVLVASILVGTFCK